MGIVNIKIEDELRNKFKAICAEKGSNMREELLKFIRKEVEKAKKGKS